ncbi:beta family protein [Vibrio sp.]|uniref:beta family protein n=1 Tax=Vibrio sp. TaxID=678 RepID=UPI003F6C642A
MSYIPFLKFKVNEVAAIKELSLAHKKVLTPFFDLPRRDEMDEACLTKIINALHRKYEINLTVLPAFYIDNFDIDDSIEIDGDDNYGYLLNIFNDTPIIPVVGIDRTERRNNVVFEWSKDIDTDTDTVALRITSDDLDYLLAEDEIGELLDNCNDNFSYVHLIIDNRMCNGVDIEERANEVIEFISDITNDYKFDKIIVTGSSIPASIRDLLEPGKTETFSRSEIELYRQVKKSHEFTRLGDYTTVSPNYSDIKVQGEIMRKITAPKIIYSFDDSMHVMRGYALETHPRGNKQYNDLSGLLIAKKFYRTQNYSFGDKYIYEKAYSIGKDATPSTIPKALVNLHIMYMLNDFAL